MDKTICFEPHFFDEHKQGAIIKAIEENERNPARHNCKYMACFENALEASLLDSWPKRRRL